MVYRSIIWRLIFQPKRVIQLGARNYDL